MGGITTQEAESPKRKLQASTRAPHDRKHPALPSCAGGGMGVWEQCLKEHLHRAAQGRPTRWAATLMMDQ